MACKHYPGCGCGTQSGPHSCEYEPTETERQFDLALRDLREAYQNLIRGTVLPKNYAMFANGLIGPAIRRLEKIRREIR
jgi:hypothetical protein